MRLTDQVEEHITELEELLDEMKTWKGDEELEFEVYRPSLAVIGRNIVKTANEEREE